MELGKLSIEEEEEKKEWLNMYKNVTRCSSCKKLFGYDTKSETLCALCDPEVKK